ncbi:hypothetical protein [Oceanicoccus sagamiensis]|uniref:DUF2232 domain-containing protein n=1 Tax=Oceanicoccus sagamiensis TaxID=716816 RepID=A0A1X9N8J1_9GAMM|nr:hypothetical protein [Oceanicoccus sagamiensis]ARN74388.1 hypothetical protein BST96_09790 [Oceanicoccus sagamiensis]
MKALAEYVMKGRSQAVIAAALATGTVLFAWVGAAVIALVTLRRGSSQGSQVLLWAMLPAVVMAAMGDTGPVTTLLGVMLAAIVLRSTASWSWALVAAVTSGVVTALVLLTFGRGYLEEILRLLADALTQLASQNTESTASQVAQPTVMQVAGLLGLSNAFMVVMCLILARWWQSLLYNPGGFRTEFHALRLPPQLSVALLLVGLLISTLGADYRLMAIMFALPFMFAGFALVHGLAAKRQISSNVLTMFYIAWLLFDPVKALLLIAAIVDSWIHIRGRVADKNHSPD